jgi:hypothetical protein
MYLYIFIVTLQRLQINKYVIIEAFLCVTSAISDFHYMKFDRYNLKKFSRWKNF